MTPLKTLALTASFLFPAISASAATYEYVGSWDVAYGNYSNDPLSLVWTANPPVYSGQEAAAFLFGGVATDYVISTISDAIADINFSAWVDGWGDDFTYAKSGTPAAQDFSVDLTGLGYNGCATAGIQCTGSAYSALVIDHLVGYNFTNYAFRVADANISPVPLPAGAVLLVTALGGMAALRRRKSV